MSIEQLASKANQMAYEAWQSGNGTDYAVVIYPDKSRGIEIDDHKYHTEYRVVYQTANW